MNSYLPARACAPVLACHARRLVAMALLGVSRRHANPILSSLYCLHACMCEQPCSCHLKQPKPSCSRTLTCTLASALPTLCKISCAVSPPSACLPAAASARKRLGQGAGLDVTRERIDAVWLISQAQGRLQRGCRHYDAHPRRLRRQLARALA